MAILAGAAMLVLAGCGPAGTQQETGNIPVENAPVENAPAEIMPVNRATPAPENEAEAPPAATERTSLPEPKGPIDPKSVEAAGQVVQHFGALIEQDRLSEAAKLWGSAESAGTFVKQLRPSTHLEIGELGRTEGAAGSIYTTVPVVFYGDGFRRPAGVILRRVNDVPGSTAAQRRWHIERIEWKGAA